MSAEKKRVSVGMNKDSDGAAGIASLGLAGPLHWVVPVSQNQRVVLMPCFRFAQDLFVVADVLPDCQKCSS